MNTPSLIDGILSGIDGHPDVKHQDGAVAMTHGEPTFERPSPELARLAFELFGVSLVKTAEGRRGEESVGWRGTSADGDRFVQAFPPWRTDAELMWCNSVAQAAWSVSPECVFALTGIGGRVVFAAPEGPVMIFPFVEGGHPSRDQAIAGKAAELLAAVHRGILSAWSPSLGPRPAGRSAARSPTRGDLLADPALDRLERSMPEQARPLPIHGDFYGGNLLVVDGGVKGVIDWWDAQLAPQEQEVAWAAWEFCHNETGDDLDDARAEVFLQTYVDCDGPAAVAQPFDPIPWVRKRLRLEARTWFGDPRSAGETSAYHEAQLVAFERLRTRRLPGR